KAGGSLYLNVQGELREDLPANTTFRVHFGIIAAGTDADVQLRPAVTEDNAAGLPGVLVTVPNETGFQDLTTHAPGYRGFSNIFRPDPKPMGIKTPMPTPPRSYGDEPDPSDIPSTYDFEVYDNSGNLTNPGNLTGLPGLEAGGNIIVAATKPLPA